jgi:REP element-mobilizing transposase RayT
VGRGHLWSPAYFVVSTGGAPIAVVRRYIEQQGATTALSPD